MRTSLSTCRRAIQSRAAASTPPMKVRNASWKMGRGSVSPRSDEIRAMIASRVAWTIAVTSVSAPSPLLMNAAYASARSSDELDIRLQSRPRLPPPPGRSWSTEVNASSRTAAACCTVAT